MPIPVAQLHKTERPIAERIVEFLAQHPEQAYSEVELYAEIEEVTQGTASIVLAFAAGAGARDALPFTEALAQLVKSNRIKRWTHNLLRYYSIAQEKRA